MAATSEETHLSLNIDTDTFVAYSDALQTAALTTTRLAATSLPSDLSFHRSIDPALARDVDAFSDRVLVLANRLVHVASGKTSQMREEEDVVDEFIRNVIDPMEGMLEGTDGALDVFLGKRKDPAIHVPAVPIEPPQKKPKKQSFRGRLDPALTHASHILKPQLLFKHTPSNIDESPYIPATTMPHKWCAKVPLGYVFNDERSELDVGNIREDDDEEDRRKRTLHPYYYELTHPSYPEHAFNPPAKPSFPSSLDISSPGSPTHPLTFISTPTGFLSMANTIAAETELAVDLEHHSYRSYKGFLALMQISTRQEDFVIDLLVPEIREGLRQAKGKSARESEEACMASKAGQIVAKAFADPSIIKVFHGAESDIVWLQQDFNIFVIGLFDTYHASRLLEFPKHSLAYLLETYCDFIADKRYQLADWRIRPLPAEMTTYARSDTHFLLYVYDMLRLSLIERQCAGLAITSDTASLTNPTQVHSRDLIHSVLARSAHTALRLYEAEVYDAEGGTGPNGWDTLAKKWNKVALASSSTQIGATKVPQVAVYKAVHRWREDIAREEDESTRYVLPTHHLFLLAERVPTTVSDLLSLFGGPEVVHGRLPPVLKRRTTELVAEINGAIGATKATSSPREPGEDRYEGSGAVISTIVEQSEATSLTTPSATAVRPTDESRLWTVTPPSQPAKTISVSHSSLFGAGISGKRTEGEGVTSPASIDREETYLTRESTLFGNAFPEIATASSSRTTRSVLTRTEVPGDTAERFRHLVEKIHKTLVIAPAVSISSVPASVRTQTQTLETSLSGVSVNTDLDENSSAAHETSELPSCPVGQIEIPFVPAHKRQTLSNPQNYELKDDTIVVVGQASTRQRKRKRDKARVASTSQSKHGIQLGVAEPSTHTGNHDQEVEEFDYSNVPNLLDDETMHAGTRSVHEEERRKKQRHGKGSGLFEYGNFRATPRGQREIRSGNKTHTFR